MGHDELGRLQALSGGFRTRYLDHGELTEQVNAWAKAFPDLVRAESVAKTREGRDVWVLTIGPEPDRGPSRRHVPEQLGPDLAPRTRHQCLPGSRPAHGNVSASSKD